MRKYDHLFFDLDNTLWDFESNSKLALKQTFEELSINNHVSFEEFFEYYQRINESLWGAYREKEITKKELVKTRFEKPLNKFKIAGIDPLIMNECYLNLMPLQNKLIEGVLPTLDYLANRGYKMHIITNGFKQVQHKKLETSGLRKYFNWIFISEEVQAPKPDKLIFQHALKNCNAKKSKSIMIGDSWESDILGAHNFGIDQVFFRNDDKNVVPNNEFEAKTNGNTSVLNINSSLKTYSISKLIFLNEIL
ncbi:YjjG family noncanonical pyrimidine nucleotidase [Sunxiuqinia sp. A32]|uniref:YjjG family noncanonical pyrimidine nucleotidase n=1 Tax=Sunxiuqinia sp. A32 TaxID=3461496 RepID=UPI0040465BEC